MGQHDSGVSQTWCLRLSSMKLWDIFPCTGTVTFSTAANSRRTHFSWTLLYELSRDVPMCFDARVPLCLLSERLEMFLSRENTLCCSGSHIEEAVNLQHRILYGSVIFSLKQALLRPRAFCPEGSFMLHWQKYKRATAADDTSKLIHISGHH